MNRYKLHIPKQPLWPEPAIDQVWIEMNNGIEVKILEKFPDTDRWFIDYEGSKVHLSKSVLHRFYRLKI